MILSGADVKQYLKFGGLSFSPYWTKNSFNRAAEKALDTK